jgi:hypothetical protein
MRGGTEQEMGGKRANASMRVNGMMTLEGVDIFRKVEGIDILRKLIFIHV